MENCVFQVLDRGSHSFKWSEPMALDALANIEVHSTPTLVFNDKTNRSHRRVIGEDAWLAATQAKNPFSYSLEGGLKTMQKKRGWNRFVTNEMTDAIARPETCNTFILPMSIKYPVDQEKREMERVFESLGARMLGRPRNSACILAASGVFDGVVLDLGHHAVEIESICDGYTNFSETKTNLLAGEFMTRQIADIVEDRLGIFIGSNDYLFLHNLDRFKCRHAVFQRSSSLSTSQFAIKNNRMTDSIENQPPTTMETIQHTLPDGHIIAFDPFEDFNRCTERVISPLAHNNESRPGGISPPVDTSLTGSETGVPEDLYRHTMRLSIDVRLEHLSTKIYVAGGMTKTTGIIERFQNELEILYHAETGKQVTIEFAVAHRPVEATVDGATLLALTTPPKSDMMLDPLKDASDWWISRAMWNEHGAERIHGWLS